MGACRRTSKPQSQSVNKQTNERTNNTHAHISTAIDRQTDLQPTKKMKMMLPATKVLVSVLAFSACLSQTARVSFASTITPFQDVEGGLAGVGQDLVSEFGGGIQVESRFDDQGLLEGTVSEEDFLDSSAGGRNLQADFGDAANVAKDILKIVTGPRPLVKTLPMLLNMEGETCRLTLAMQRTSRRTFLRSPRVSRPLVKTLPMLLNMEGSCRAD